MKFEMKPAEKNFQPFTISVDIETEDEFVEFLLRMNVNFASVRDDAEDSYQGISGLYDSTRGWGEHFNEVWVALDNYRAEHKLFGHKLFRGA